MDRVATGRVSRRLLAVLGLLLVLCRAPLPAVQAQSASPSETPRATPADLIREANRLRSANGLQPLTANSILMSTAQWTADTMAANHISGHLGNVRGRVMAAGYGGGVDAWATENIMTGNLSAEEVWAGAWSDDLHRIPATNPIYCDVGAGVAQDEEGQVYYVLHAAYNNNRTCGAYIGPGGTTLPGQPTLTPVVLGDERIFPVQTVTAAPDGTVVHIVQPGQSLWSIAIAYGLKIRDILRFNGLADSSTMIYNGQKLKIPVTLSPPSPTAAQSVGTPRPEDGVAADERQGTAVSPDQASSTISMTPELQQPKPTITPLPPTPAGPGSRSDPVLVGILALFGLGVILIGIGLFARRPR